MGGSVSLLQRAPTKCCDHHSLVYDVKMTDSKKNVLKMCSVCRQIAINDEMPTDKSITTIISIRKRTDQEPSNTEVCDRNTPPSEMRRSTATTALLIYSNFFYRKAFRSLMEPHCDNVLEADDEDSAIKAISTDTGKDIQLVILDEFLIFLADSRTTMVNSLREAGYTGEIWVSSSMTYKGFVADYLLMGVDGLISKSCASLGLQDVYQVAVQA